MSDATAQMRAAIAKACQIIETGDERLLADDGPAGGQPPRLTLPEWRELYVTLDNARKLPPAIASTNPLKADLRKDCADLLRLLVDVGRKYITQPTHRTTDWTYLLKRIGFVLGRLVMEEPAAPSGTESRVSYVQTPREGWWEDFEKACPHLTMSAQRMPPDDSSVFLCDNPKCDYTVPYPAADSPAMASGLGAVICSKCKNETFIGEPHECVS